MDRSSYAALSRCRNATFGCRSLRGAPGCPRHEHHVAGTLYLSRPLTAVGTLATSFIWCCGSRSTRTLTVAGIGRLRRWRYGALVKSRALAGDCVIGIFRQRSSPDSSRLRCTEHPVNEDGTVRYALTVRKDARNQPVSICALRYVFMYTHAVAARCSTLHRNDTSRSGGGTPFTAPAAVSARAHRRRRNRSSGRRVAERYFDFAPGANTRVRTGRAQGASAARRPIATI